MLNGWVQCHVTLSHLESTNVEFNVMACYDISTVIFILEVVNNCDYVKLMFILDDSCETPTLVNESCSSCLVFQ